MAGEVDAEADWHYLMMKTQAWYSFQRASLLANMFHSAAHDLLITRPQKPCMLTFDSCSVRQKLHLFIIVNLTIIPHPGYQNFSPSSQAVAISQQPTQSIKAYLLSS